MSPKKIADELRYMATRGDDCIVDFNAQDATVMSFEYDAGFISNLELDNIELESIDGKYLDDVVVINKDDFDGLLIKLEGSGTNEQITELRSRVNSLCIHMAEIRKLLEMSNDC